MNRPGLLHEKSQLNGREGSDPHRTPVTTALSFTEEFSHGTLTTALDFVVLEPALSGVIKPSTRPAVAFFAFFLCREGRSTIGPAPFIAARQRSTPAGQGDNVLKLLCGHMGKFGACRTCHDLNASPRTHEKSFERVASCARKTVIETRIYPSLDRDSPVVEELTQEGAAEEMTKTDPPLLDWSIDVVDPALDKVDAAEFTVLSITARESERLTDVTSR